MDILPSGNIFQELDILAETGGITSQPSLEEIWQQVSFEVLYLII